MIATGTRLAAERPAGAAAAQGRHACLARPSRSAASVKVNLLAEVFNVFNWENYGSYNTQLDSASFGQPVANSGNAYASRSGQLGLRVEF